MICSSLTITSSRELSSSHWLWLGTSHSDCAQINFTQCTGHIHTGTSWSCSSGKRGNLHFGHRRWSRWCLEQGIQPGGGSQHTLQTVPISNHSKSYHTFFFFFWNLSRTSILSKDTNHRVNLSNSFGNFLPILQENDVLSTPHLKKVAPSFTSEYENSVIFFLYNLTILTKTETVSSESTMLFQICKSISFMKFRTW